VLLGKRLILFSARPFGDLPFLSSLQSPSSLHVSLFADFIRDYYSSFFVGVLCELFSLAAVELAPLSFPCAHASPCGAAPHLSLPVVEMILFYFSFFPCLFTLPSPSLHASKRERDASLSLLAPKEKWMPIPVSVLFPPSFLFFGKKLGL